MVVALGDSRNTDLVSRCSLRNHGLCPWSCEVVRIAAVRKLLLIAHAIYKSGEAYHLPNEKEG
jgi:hypothetical protein